MRLKEIVALGLQVHVEDGDLVVVGVLTDDLIAKIRAAKPAILAELAHKSPVRSLAQMDPTAPCPACGCSAWHRIQSAPEGRWWCSSCWPAPEDLPPVSTLAVPGGWTPGIAPEAPKEAKG